MTKLPNKLRQHCTISYSSALLLVMCTLNPLSAFSESMNHEGMKHGETNHEEMNPGEMKHSSLKQGEHKHSPIDVANWPATPSLTLTAHKDLASGWNLHIVPMHFKFTPENVNTPPRPGEGHAHLYIDGEKITRLYSQWFYLNNLAPGRHTITITLNANDHGPLVTNGEAIATTIEIVQE